MEICYARVKAKGAQKYFKNLLLEFSSRKLINNSVRRTGYSNQHSYF